MAGEDRDGDAAGKADGHRVRNIADQRAEPGQADDGEHHAREKDGDEQPVQPKSCDRGRHQNDKCAGRTANLKPAAAQSRDKKATDDGRIKPAHRFDAGRHGDGHGQRKRHHGYGERGRDVAPKGFETVAFGNERNQFGTIEMSCGGTVRHCGNALPMKIVSL